MNGLTGRVESFSQKRSKMAWFQKFIKISRAISVMNCTLMIKKWKQNAPLHMPTARYDPGVVSLQSALIVAGGDIGHATYTNTVEIFKHDCMHWLKTNPLLLDCYRISLVAIGNTCYVLGGFKHSFQHLNQALQASVDDLLHNAVPADKASSCDTQTLCCWPSVGEMGVGGKANN